MCATLRQTCSDSGLGLVALTGRVPEDASYKSAIIYKYVRSSALSF